MIADLHCHYPMHVMMDDPRERVRRMTKGGRRPAGDRLRARVLRIASSLFSDSGFWAGERVNLEYLSRGDVRLVFSVLHSPFSELDLERGFHAPPQSGYFGDLMAQIEKVEAYVDAWPDEAVAVVRDLDGLDRVLQAGGIALVHCLEGGVDLGPSDEEIRRNVARLKERGLVYITLAHLFYRGFATNAPALPMLKKDWVYKLLFKQPDDGLSERGRTAVEAMADNRIMVDVAHMRADAERETFDLLRERGSDLPVINSHAGYKCGGQSYMCEDWEIEEIARTGGVIGLILAQYQMNDGIRKKETETFEESFDVIRTHIEKIRAVTGNLDHIGIGTDFDGFIKPSMAGLEKMSDMPLLEAALVREYGAENAERICAGNAERVLRRLWSA